MTDSTMPQLLAQLQAVAWAELAPKMGDSVELVDKLHRLCAAMGVFVEYGGRLPGVLDSQLQGLQQQLQSAVDAAQLAAETAVQLGADQARAVIAADRDSAVQAVGALSDAADQSAQNAATAEGEVRQLVTDLEQELALAAAAQQQLLLHLQQSAENNRLEIRDWLDEIERIVDEAEAVAAGDVIDDSGPKSHRVYSSAEVERQIAAAQLPQRVADGAVLTPGRWLVDSGITVSLPGSAVWGDQLVLIPAGDWAAIPAQLLRNGGLIWGLAEGLRLDQSLPLTLTYKGPVAGWEF